MNPSFVRLCVLPQEWTEAMLEEVVERIEELEVQELCTLLYGYVAQKGVVHAQCLPVSVSASSSSSSMPSAPCHRLLRMDAGQMHCCSILISLLGLSVHVISACLLMCPSGWQNSSTSLMSSRRRPSCSAQKRSSHMVCLVCHVIVLGCERVVMGFVCAAWWQPRKGCVLV